MWVYNLINFTSYFVKFNRLFIYYFGSEFAPVGVLRFNFKTSCLTVLMALIKKLVSKKT